MADKAQSEPTMEEILASIRKIIADDGESSRSSAQAEPQDTRSVDVNVSDDDDFDDLSLEDVMAETESDDVNDPADNYFANNQQETSSDADFDLMEKEDASGSLLADVDDDMFDDLSSDEGTSNENDFAPEAPQPFESQPDELEDFDLASGDDNEDDYVAISPRQTMSRSSSQSQPSIPSLISAWSRTPGPIRCQAPRRSQNPLSRPKLTTTASCLISIPHHPSRWNRKQSRLSRT